MKLSSWYPKQSGANGELYKEVEEKEKKILRKKFHWNVNKRSLNCIFFTRAGVNELFIFFFDQQLFLKQH
jgi:hypothetical protein